MTTSALAIDGRLVVGETLRVAGFGSVTGLKWQALVNGTWTNVATGTSSYVIPSGATGVSYRVVGTAIDDGSTIYSTATGSITIDTKKASAPVFTTSDLAAIGYEGPDPRPVFGSYSFSDADKGNYGGGTLLLQDTTATMYGGDGHDALGVRFLGTSAGQFSYNAATHEVKYAFTSGVATTIGTIDSTLNGNGTDLKVTFNSNATQAVVGALIGNLQYVNNDDSPTADRLFTLRITDPTGGSVQRVVGSHIENTPDAPVFTSSSFFAIDENQTAVGTVAAVDPDRESNQPQGITYSLVSGDGSPDSALFTIDAVTGALRFKTAPDYEDHSRLPRYNLLVRATDSDGSTTDQGVSIDVHNVNEAPFAFPVPVYAQEDGGPVTFVANVWDQDANDSYTIAVDTSQLHGTLAWSGRTFTYDPHGALEWLPAWMTGTDQFTYTVTDAGGLSTTVTMNVFVQGENDPATISGGLTATVQEDAGNGMVFVSGKVVVNDIDQGDNMITSWTPAAANLGSFTVGIDGTWIYWENNAAMQSLGAGETHVDTATIHSADGTASAQLAVTLVGVNDAPVISLAQSTVAGDVTEAGAGGSGTWAATGRLAGSDVDAHDTLMWAGSHDGKYGAFAIDASTGQWTYTLDNSRPATQALVPGQTVYDSFTTYLMDNVGGLAQQVVKIAVHGANDTPGIAATSQTSGTVQVPAASGTLAISTGATPWDQHATIVDATGHLAFAAPMSDGMGGASYVLARYSTTGAPDASFGDNGHVALGGSFNPLDLAQDAAGDYLVVGYGWLNYNASQTDWTIERFTAGGSLDTSFGQGGRMDIDFGGYDRAQHVFAQASGRVLVAGAAGAAGQGVLALDASGHVDTSYATQGLLTFGDDSIVGVTADAQGRVVAWGWHNDAATGTTTEFIERFSSGGQLDTTFGDAGRTTLDTMPASVAVDADGRLAIGWTESAGLYNSPVSVELLDASGHAVTSFGSGGVVHTGIDGWSFSVGFDASHHPLLAVTSHGSTGSELVRFGNDGSGQASFAQEPDTVSGIESLANGNVLVTGNAAYDNGGGFAYAAFTSSGALDPRFGAYPAATVSGQLTAVDGDAGDLAHWGGSAAGAYGSFAIAVDGSWTYTLDPSNAAALSLAPDATLTEDFLATVTDSFGAHADCHVLVTIVGTPAS